MDKILENKTSIGKEYLKLNNNHKYDSNLVNNFFENDQKIKNTKKKNKKEI